MFKYAWNISAFSWSNHWMVSDQINQSSNNKMLVQASFLCLRSVSVSKYIYQMKPGDRPSSPLSLGVFKKWYFFTPFTITCFVTSFVLLWRCTLVDESTQENYKPALYILLHVPGNTMTSDINWKSKASLGIQENTFKQLYQPQQRIINKNHSARGKIQHNEMLELWNMRNIINYMRRIGFISLVGQSWI